MDDPVDLFAPVGDIVRLWREHRGLTQQQLSQAASRAYSDISREGRTISKSYVSQLEIGRITHSSPDRLQALAEALSIPVTYLLLRTPPDTATEHVRLEPPALRNLARLLTQLEADLLTAAHRVADVRSLLAGDDDPPDASP